MKKNLILSCFAILSFVVVSLASNINLTSNVDDEIKSKEIVNEDLKKWNITADVWIISEGEWYEYPQMITICWRPDTGYYMWSYGGATRSVQRSDKRGYDFMVNSNSHRDWRFYFHQSDLR